MIVGYIVLIGFLFALLLLICFIIGFKKPKNKCEGLFIVDDSDPETIRWILDVKMDPEEILNKKEIRLKICKMEERSCE